MGFKPNFEINFKPSVSAFKDDNKQGLTHTSAGLSTEFIILGENTDDLEARISPYGTDDFLEGEGAIRKKVANEIQEGVREKFDEPSSSNCEQNDRIAAKIRAFMNNVPDEVGDRKMSSKARRSIATKEAEIALQRFEAAISAYCIVPAGEDDLTDAERAAQAAEDALLAGEKSAPMSIFGGNPLFIIGGAVVLGGILFFAIRK